MGLRKRKARKGIKQLKLKSSPSDPKSLCVKRQFVSKQLRSLSTLGPSSSLINHFVFILREMKEGPKILLENKAIDIMKQTMMKTSTSDEERKDILRLLNEIILPCGCCGVPKYNNDLQKDFISSQCPELCLNYIKSSNDLELIAASMFALSIVSKLDKANSFAYLCQISRSIEQINLTDYRVIVTEKKHSQSVKKIIDAMEAQAIDAIMEDDKLNELLEVKGGECSKVVQQAQYSKVVQFGKSFKEKAEDVPQEDIWTNNPSEEVFGEMQENAWNNEPLYEASEETQEDTFTEKPTQELPAIVSKYTENTISYSGFVLLASVGHLQECFRQTLINHRKIWQHRRIFNYCEFNVNSFRESIKIEIETLQEMLREWNMLMESWEKRKEITEATIQEVFNIINTLDRKIKLKVDEVDEQERLRKLEHYKWKLLYMENTSENLSEVPKKPLGIFASSYDANSSIYESKLHQLKMLSIAKTADPILDALYVSPSNKFKFSSHSDGPFEEVKLGATLIGEAVVIKCLKSECDKKLITSLVSQMNESEFVHILPSYFLYDSENSILYNHLMECNLGQMVLRLFTNNTLEKYAKDIVRQLVDGMEYLHSRNPPIIHGNLKPTNILFDGKGVLKISEFGLSSVLNNKLIIQPSNLIWKSREQVLNNYEGVDLDATHATDVYTTGMLVYFILSGGSHPFGVKVEEILYNMSRDIRMMKTENHQDIFFINDFLEKRPERRIHMSQVKNHIYWWSEEKQWNVATGYSFVTPIIAYVLNETIQMQSQKGKEDIVEAMNKWLKIVGKPIKDVGKQLTTDLKTIPKLPLYLYKILRDTHWTKAEYLKQLLQSDKPNYEYIRVW